MRDRRSSPCASATCSARRARSCRSSASRSRRGGPVTVTRPEMTRYFMTIPEAAQLIVQAGGVGRGGDVFVLDMGDPVRIIDLANDMIRLSGLEPERDIPVVDHRHPARREAARGASSRTPRRSSAPTTRSSCARAARRSPPEWLDVELDARRAPGQRGRRGRGARARARHDRQPASRRQRAARRRCAGVGRSTDGHAAARGARAPSSSGGRSPRPPSRSASRSRPCRWPCARSSSGSASR